jgi:cellulose biosynthesis protein BcsQ
MPTACRCLGGVHPGGMLIRMQVSEHADAVVSPAGTPADLSVLSRCIAVVNGKGGVGKTSLTANLAGLYAAAGYRTLAIDLDPQGNLGDDLGYLGAGLSDDGAELVDALRTQRAYRPLRDVRPGLDVLAGGPVLGELNSDFYGGHVSADTVLTFASSLAQIADGYDLILVDCPPGNDALQESALAAARWVLIPTKSDPSSRAGLQIVAARFSAIRAQYNPDLELLGVVLFGVNSAATRLISEARRVLGEDLGLPGALCETSIRHVEAAAFDARSRGQLVHELERDVHKGPSRFQLLRMDKETRQRTRTLAASAGSLAADYQRLAEELIDRIVASETAEGRRA